MDLMELSWGHQRFHQPVFFLFLLLSINKGGNRTWWVGWRKDGWGLHLKVFILSCSHLYTQEKKKEKKKVMVTEGKHHKTWHTRTSARGGFRVNTHTHTHTHGTVKGLRALGSGSRGPVLAHTQIQSHTSTVHGTRGHLNTWSQWGRANI